MLRRIREGLGWRLRGWGRYLFLLRSFRNGVSLARSYQSGFPCERAVCWSGAVLSHPAGRAGLVETLLEVWHDEAYTRDFYEPASGDTVIDAGANIGLFALWIAGREASCRVIAFEPSQENYELLRRNTESMGASSVTPIRAGLSADAGFARMEETGRRSLDHRLIASDSSETDAGGDIVHVYSYAQVLELAQGGPIDLFKIDIEGSEMDFLARASPQDLRRVKRFAIEYHDNIRPGTLDFLTAHLGRTHDLRVVRTPNRQYGMLFATLAPGGAAQPDGQPA